MGEYARKAKDWAASGLCTPFDPGDTAPNDDADRDAEPHIWECDRILKETEEVAERSKGKSANPALADLAKRLNAARQKI